VVKPIVLDRASDWSSLDAAESFWHANCDLRLAWFLTDHALCYLLDHRLQKPTHGERLMNIVREWLSSVNNDSAYIYIYILFFFVLPGVIDLCIHQLSWSTALLCLSTDDHQSLVVLVYEFVDLLVCFVISYGRWHASHTHFAIIHRHIIHANFHVIWLVSVYE